VTLLKQDAGRTPNRARVIHMRAPAVDPNGAKRKQIDGSKAH
jgi:hypothetical protein